MSPQGHQQNLSLGTHPVDNAELCYPRDNIVDSLFFFEKTADRLHDESEKSRSAGHQKKAQSSQKKQKKCQLLHCVTGQPLRAGLVRGGAPRRSSNKKNTKRND